MKIVLILGLCYAAVYGQKKPPIELLAANEKYFFDLQQKYLNEEKCLKRIDAILKSKWTEDLEKISTTGLGSVEPESATKESAIPMYNTIEQEWLIGSGSAAREIDSCIRGLVPDIVPSINQADTDCLNAIFAHHIEEELVHEDVFDESLRSAARDQLPFRRFVSFLEFGELMFQGRTPDALGDLERVVSEHAESYLATDEDRVNPTYIMEQECEWKNARSLREASNVDARLDEFTRQVRDSVNQQLASRVVKNWNLESTLPRDKYLAWLKVRENTTTWINGEVARLRNQRKDAQWLCEHATKLAYRISDEQADVLIGEENSSFDPEVSEVAAKARGIERAMERRKDFRHPVLEVLADKYENGTRCFAAFLHLVRNHRRFDIALSLVDGRYNYPQFYCKGKSLNLGLISTRFCKCVGSFCVHHALAALFAEEYLLKQGPDGTYRVVLSGLKSREKVQAWESRD